MALSPKICALTIGSEIDVRRRRIPYREVGRSDHDQRNDCGGFAYFTS
jgi:hypothetical protein